MTYAELQVTTHFSFLRGASSPRELFEQAKLLGLPALGIADRNSLAGIVRAHEAARRRACASWSAAASTSRTAPRSSSTRPTAPPIPACAGS